MAQIKIIRSEEGLQELKPEWDTICASQEDVRVFQTFEWNYNGWIHYQTKHYEGCQLFVLHATRDGHPDQRLILPFCRFRDGRVEFIAQMISDVVDAVVPVHQDNWNNFYADIIEFLNASQEVESISFIHVTGSSEFVKYLMVYGKRLKMVRMDSYSYLCVRKTDSFSASLVHMTSKERSYVKSLLGKTFDGNYRVLSRAAGDVFPQTELLRLRDWMCKAGLRDIRFFPDEMLEFIGGVYNDGFCEIAVIEQDDGALDAASFRIFQKSHINFWVVFYKEVQLTTLLDCKYMAEKAACGDYVFDFGTGAYKYKLGTFRPLVDTLYRVASEHMDFWGLLRDFRHIIRVYLRYWIKGA